MRRILRPNRKIRWSDLVVVVVGLVLLARTSENISRMSKNSRILSSVEAQVQEAREENIRLQGELSWVKSSEFIEREARDKLGLGREGEVILILPEEDPEISNSDSQNPSIEMDKRSNWKKWWDLYVKI